MQSEGLWWGSGCPGAVLSQLLLGTAQIPALPCSSLALLGADPCFSARLLEPGPGLISFPTLPPALGWKEAGQVAVDAQCQQDHDSG